MPTKAELIESRINTAQAGSLSINRHAGGMDFRSMSEVMEFAKLMAVSSQAVPQHCREQPGICLGIAIQAIEWRMSPYAVAGKSYVVNDMLAYESQLIHAVIEQRAPITSRLRCDYAGSGDKRTCRVWATPKGEAEPLSYESPPIGQITPKNSPLWKTKPDLQLFYNTSRDWARMYFPDVILGVYADDEIVGEMDSRPVKSTPPKRITTRDLDEVLADKSTPVGTTSEVGDFTMEAETEWTRKVDDLLDACKTAKGIEELRKELSRECTDDEMQFELDTRCQDRIEGMK